MFVIGHFYCCLASQMEHSSMQNVLSLVIFSSYHLAFFFPFVPFRRSNETLDITHLFLGGKRTELRYNRWTTYWDHLYFENFLLFSLRNFVQHRINYLKHQQIDENVHLVLLYPFLIQEDLHLNDSKVMVTDHKRVEMYLEKVD